MTTRKKVAGNGGYEYPLPDEIVKLEQKYKPPSVVRINLPDEGLKVDLKFTRNGCVTVADVVRISIMPRHSKKWLRLRIPASGVAYCNPSDEPAAFVGDRVAAKRAIQHAVRFTNIYKSNTVDYHIAKNEAAVYKEFRRKQRHFAGWRGVESPRKVKAVEVSDEQPNMA
jgi:hypothetical protein